MKLYLVIVEKFEDERCSVVTIHKTERGAKNAIKAYKFNGKRYNNSLSYYIKEINLDIDSDIIFDCVTEEELHFNNYE